LVTKVLPYGKMIEIREYIDREGGSPFAKWFNRLSSPAAAKVVTALVRMEQGNLSNTKGVGGGVLECRIDFGPGYRVYFGKDGDVLIILLGGGTKKRQQKDIENARTFWREYKLRKRKES
jgi:putative addiction module killer protein